MRVMGVDLSSRSIACVWLGDGPYEPGAIKLHIPNKVKDRYQVAKMLFDSGLDRFKHGPDTTVFIEEPVVAGVRNLRSSLLIAQICGVMMGICAASGMESVYLVPVSSWKKETVGHGNADKQCVRSWLNKNKPEIAAVCGRDQDLIDAACIALYGQGLLSRVDGIRDQLSHGT